MLWPEQTLAERERPRVERRRLGEAALDPIELGQVVEARRHVRMIRTQRLLA